MERAIVHSAAPVALGRHGTRGSGLTGPLWALVAIVLANYAAQIPYGLHLYGLAVNWRGVALLLLTLIWFVGGIWLLSRRHRIGYWLTLAFLATQVVFYFRNEVLLIPAGYGLPYLLLHARDLLVLVVFVVGDINFFAAIFFVGYFLRRRRTLLSGQALEAKSAYS